MSKRLHAFDILVFLAILAALFAVGAHLGKDRTRERGCEISVCVELEKFKGSAPVGTVVLMDGKYPLRIVETDETFITATATAAASLEEAGYLIGGAKYVAENQPVKASWEGGYLEGRIFEIHPYSG